MRNPADTVHDGDRFSLQRPIPIAALPQPQAIPFTVLYEDADLIVLDKPAGLVVHPAPGNEDGTLVNALLAHCGDTLPGIGGEKRPGIVHRLDKDTSGVMVAAKTEIALATLSASFCRARSGPALYRRRLGSCRHRVEGRDRGGASAATRAIASAWRSSRPAASWRSHRYLTLRAWAPTASLLQLTLATGRTHQIRVHLAERGHPLVGDPVYLRRVPAAAKSAPAPLRQLMLDFPRQALHAASLGLRPSEGRKSGWNLRPNSRKTCRISLIRSTRRQAILDRTILVLYENTRVRGRADPACVGNACPSGAISGT